jgi:hypothetical protein
VVVGLRVCDDCGLCHSAWPRLRRSGGGPRCRLRGRPSARRMGTVSASLRRPAIQTCLAHPIRRCREIADRPRRVQVILQHALNVRDRLADGEISAQGAAIARGHLLSQLLDVLDPPGTWPTGTALRRISRPSCPRSSAFCLIQRSTRRTGARSSHFGRRSSIGKYPAAIARSAAREPRRFEQRCPNGALARPGSASRPRRTLASSETHRLARARHGALDSSRRDAKRIAADAIALARSALG